MQINHFFLSSRMLFCSLFLLTAGLAAAQKITSNENGEKIIIYDDGSWRFFNAETDSHLENAQPSKQQVNQAEEAVGRENPLNGEPRSAKVKKAKKPKNSKGQKVKSKKNKGKKSKGKKAKNKKGKNSKKNKKQKSGKSKKPKAMTDKGTDQEWSPETRELADTEIISLAEKAAAHAAQTQSNLEDVAFNRISLEEELQHAYNSMATTDGDLANIESRLQKAKANEKLAEETHKKATYLAKQYERMVDMSPKKRQKLLTKLANDGVDVPVPVSSRVTGVPQTGGSDEPATANRPINQQNQKLARSNQKKYEASNVMLHPPLPACQLTFDGLDEFSGKSRRDVAKQHFFAYTSDKMRPYLKGQEYISCHGNLTSISGGLKYLSLEIEVSSETAQRDYGFIEKEAPIVILFINGTNLRLYNRKTDMGTLNPLEKSVIYKPQYMISSTQEKELKKNEVDKVRVVWSSGYEDYEVFELDFFINQFRCLEQE